MDRARIWMIARLIRVKQMPDYQEFVGIQKPAQHWQDMQAMVAAAGAHARPK